MKQKQRKFRDQLDRFFNRNNIAESILDLLFSADDLTDYFFAIVQLFVGIIDRIRDQKNRKETSL